MRLTESYTWNWIIMRRVSYPPGSLRCNHTHFRLQRSVIAWLYYHIIAITIHSFSNFLVFVKTEIMTIIIFCTFGNLIPAVEDDVALFSNLKCVFTEHLWYVIGLLQTRSIIIEKIGFMQLYQYFLILCIIFQNLPVSSKYWTRALRFNSHHFYMYPHNSCSIT